MERPASYTNIVIAVSYVSGVPVAATGARVTI